MKVISKFYFLKHRNREYEFDMEKLQMKNKELRQGGYFLILIIHLKNKKQAH